MKEEICDKILMDYEMKHINGDYSWMVDESTIKMVDKPVIQDGTGKIMFKVEFTSIIFRPFKNEVVSAEVTRVGKVGLILDYWPCRIFISASNLKDADFEY